MGESGCRPAGRHIQWFDRFSNAFGLYCDAVRVVTIHLSVHACRDPRDDKFLEVAVNGMADLIVTGDDDLLVLDRFRPTRILTPKQFLEMRDYRRDLKEP